MATEKLNTKPNNIVRGLIEDKDSSGTNRLLAIVLIILVWIAVLVVGIVLGLIFNGGQFVIRLILIQPFSIGAAFATRIIWHTKKPL